MSAFVEPPTEPIADQRSSCEAASGQIPCGVVPISSAAPVPSDARRKIVPSLRRSLA